MTILTKYSQSIPLAPRRSMKKYTKTLFAMGKSSRTLMMRKSAPTSQPGSRRRPLLTIWTLTIVSPHARLQSMDVKPAPIQIIHSNVSEMGPTFVFTQNSSVMAILSVTLRKMKIWSFARRHILTRKYLSSMQPIFAKVLCTQT